MRAEVYMTQTMHENTTVSFDHEQITSACHEGLDERVLPIH